MMKPIRINKIAFLSFIQKNNKHLECSNDELTSLLKYINEYLEYQYEASSITKKRQNHAKNIARYRYVFNRERLYSYITLVESVNMPNQKKPKNPYAIKTIANHIELTEQTVRNIIKRIAINYDVMIPKGKFKEYISTVFTIAYANKYM